jgi:uncharacterized lipoprotein YbaY
VSGQVALPYFLKYNKNHFSSASVTTLIARVMTERFAVEMENVSAELVNAKSK